MEFEYFLLTDTGRVRHNNEDAVAAEAKAGLVVLADGMGGYNAGEVASGIATSFLTTELGLWLQESADQASDQDIAQAMAICTDNANRAIFAASQSERQYQGMGTTLVMGVFRPEGVALLGHVGDSRAYRYRAGQLTQLTKDHSLLQEQMDAGLLTPEQAARSIHKNLVTRAVGVGEEVLMDVQRLNLETGDLLLMCSDGLSDMLSPAEIARVVADHTELGPLAQALIFAANHAGGRDNISVVLVRAVEPGTVHSRFRFQTARA